MQLSTLCPRPQPRSGFHELRPDFAKHPEGVGVLPTLRFSPTPFAFLRSSSLDVHTFQNAPIPYSRLTPPIVPRRPKVQRFPAPPFYAEAGILLRIVFLESKLEESMKSTPRCGCNHPFSISSHIWPRSALQKCEFSGKFNGARVAQGRFRAAQSFCKRPLRTPAGSVGAGESRCSRPMSRSIALTTGLSNYPTMALSHVLFDPPFEPPLSCARVTRNLREKRTIRTSFFRAFSALSQVGTRRLLHRKLTAES